MNAASLRWDRAAQDPDLKALLEADVLLEGLSLVPAEAFETPLTIRPPIVDLEDDWVQPIERALAPAVGTRIGVVGEDGSLASVVAVELAVRLGDRGSAVVLIDGSVENPTLAKALIDDGDEGLVDVVLFGVSAAVGVRRTLAPGVRLVTAGSYPLSAREVFEAEAFSVFLSMLSEEATVVLALPRRYLAFAAPALTSVVAVGASADELRSVAAEARGLSVLGILAAAPQAQARAPEEEAFDRREAAASGPKELGEDGAAEPALIGAPESPAIESRTPEPVTEPGVSPAARERRSEATAVEGGREATEPVAATSWVGDHTGPVATAARSRELVRRRSWRLPAIVLTVAAIAIAAAWFGNRAFRGAPERPADEGTPRAADRIAERAGGESEGVPSGETEVPGSGVVVEEPVTPAATDAAQETTAEPPAGPIAGPGGPYTVFISSHRIASDARSEFEALARAGVSATIIPTEVGETGVWHRVAVSGGYPRLAAARAALAEVHRLGYGGAWIERSQESR